MPMKRIYETLNNVEDSTYMSSGTVKYKCLSVGKKVITCKTKVYLPATNRPNVK